MERHVQIKLGPPQPITINIFQGPSPKFADLSQLFQPHPLWLLAGYFLKKGGYVRVLLQVRRRHRFLPQSP